MSVRLLAVLAVLAGCAAPAPPAAPLAGLTFPDGATATTALPVTVCDTTGAEITVADTGRIVAVNGDLVEVVHALGLGPNLVARDRSATWPPEVQGLPVIGYQRALTPEPIAAVSPTVVLADTQAGPPGVVAQLRGVAPTVVLDRAETLDGPPDKIRAVARVLGVPARGDELANRVAAEIAAARTVAAAAPARPRVAVLYLRGPGTVLLLGSASGAGALLAGAGATDLAAELGVADTAPHDAEALIAAAPDALVVTAGVGRWRRRVAGPTARRPRPHPRRAGPARPGLRGPVPPRLRPPHRRPARRADP